MKKEIKKNKNKKIEKYVKTILDNADRLYDQSIDDRIKE